MLEKEEFKGKNFELKKWEIEKQRKRENGKRLEKN